MLSMEAQYRLDEHISTGPLLQLGYDNDRKVVAPSAVVRYHFDLDERFDVCVQGGAGAAFLERDNRPGDDNEFGFLLTRA